MSPKLIKLTTAVLALFSIALLLNSVWSYYTIRLPQNNYSTIRIVAQHVKIVTVFVLPIVLLIMIFRSKVVNSLYLALAVASYLVVIQLPAEQGGWIYFLGLILSIITGILFILSMQYFPVKITVERVNAGIRPRWLKTYLKTWLKPAGLWIGMSAILSILAVLEYFVPPLGESLSNLLILLTGFAYLYINFKLTAGLAHSKISWLFWGLFVYTVMEATYAVVFSYSEPIEAVVMVIAMLQFVALFFAFVMSVFFADAFDTGVLIRKTAINALLFLIAVFMYNTIEHFFLHWVAHTLHISDAIVSSLFSGLLVLFISPLHHRLTHYLNKKLKAKPQSSTPSLAHR